MGPNAELTTYWQHFEEAGGVVVEREPDDACAACGGLGWVRREIPDVCAAGFGRLAPCAACGTVARARRERLEAISGLSEAERALSLADFVARCQDTPAMVEAVRGFAENPCGFLTLWGGSGNGKTLALMALTNHFRERGLVSVYVTLVDLLDHIRAGFDASAEEDARQRYERVTGAYFIAVDEVDKAKVTQYAHEFRTRFLDDRYRLALELRAHTAFAMNEEPELTMPPHCYDRLRDGRFTVVHNADPSLRPAMRRNEWSGRKDIFG